jgi:hypothetical protein
MKYFQSLPQILTSDYAGSNVVVTNVLTHPLIPANLLQNPLIFYSYDIKDIDTPESIANKYYGDPYRYWLVLFPNQIIDPQWNWPMNSNLFTDYMEDKYGEMAAANNQSVVAYTQSTIQSYIKKIQTTDDYSQNTTITLYTLDAAAYANTTTYTNKTVNIGTYAATQSVTKYTQYIWDYEVQQNEAKRSIFLVNKQYVSSLESQFKALMRA